MLLMFSLLPLLSGCDNEDDVIGIFTGKPWKLSRLANKDSNRQFYSGLWKDEEAERKSRDFLKIEGNFTLNFEGSDVNGELMGTTVTGHGIHSNADGTWKILKVSNMEAGLTGNAHSNLWNNNEEEMESRWQITVTGHHLNGQGIKING